MHNDHIGCELLRGAKVKAAASAWQQKLWDMSQQSSPGLHTITLAFHSFHSIKALRPGGKRKKETQGEIGTKCLGKPRLGFSSASTGLDPGQLSLPHCHSLLPEKVQVPAPPGQALGLSA